MNKNALIQLWNLTQLHPGTSGARAAAGVLLSLYNGSRFQLDLTELRLLDGSNLTAAMAVISDDARHCQQEIHQWLNLYTGRNDFGERFEHLAWEYSAYKRGRCKREYLSPVEPARVAFRLDESAAA